MWVHQFDIKTHKNDCQTEFTNVLILFILDIFSAFYNIERLKTYICTSSTAYLCYTQIQGDSKRVLHV